MTIKPNIAIVGANSILSQSLIERLRLDYKIHQVVHLSEDKIKNKKNIIKIDDFLQSDIQFDVIYFISSVINFEESIEAIQEIFNTNVMLLLKISNKFQSAKIIHTSSISVFQSQNSVINELSQLAPKSSYALSKLWAEQVVENHPGGGVNLRLSSLYGEQMNLNTFLPIIIKQGILDKKITVFGDGSRKQNYISVDEASEYLYKAIGFSNKIPLLAVANESFSNYEVSQVIQNIMTDISIDFVGHDESNSYVFNNKITKEKLQINSNYSFSEKIGELIKWMQKQY